MLCAQLFSNADSGDQECPQAHHKIVLPTHRGGDLKEPTSFHSFPSTPAALCSAAPELGLPTLQIPRSLFTGQGWSVNFLWSLTPLFWSLLTQLFQQLYKL